MEIERRNAAYAERKAAETAARTVVMAPEVNARDIAQLDVTMSCTPRRKGWPIDHEACDLAQAEFDRRFPPEPLVLPMSPPVVPDSMIEEIIRQ